MALFAYNNNIPDGPNNPSADQPLMQENTNSIDSLLSVDHVSFNENNGGYHVDIHQVPLIADPINIAGINQLYSKFYTPNTTGPIVDTQLFAETGLGDIYQLTGGNRNNEGYSWVGGILVQWGQVTFASGNDHLTGTVTFKDRTPGQIPFPNSCYMVNATLKVASSAETTASNTISIRDITNLQFRWVYNSSSSTGSTRFPGFYWIAIGA